jgi:hypothetical protein
MLPLALTILSLRNLRLRLFMHNLSHHCTNSSHPSLTVFPIQTTALTLVVFLHHLLHHLPVSVAHQLKPLARVPCLPMVYALQVPHRKCVLSSRTERDLHGTATKGHINTMLIPRPPVVLLAELLRQLLPKLLLSKQPVNVTTGRRPPHQSNDTANGRLNLIT